MFPRLSIPSFLKLVVLSFGLLMPVMGQVSATKPDEKSAPKFRFICVSILAGEQEVVLASRDDKGGWLEHGTVKLRSSFISDWQPAKAVQMHLALREVDTLRSICQFNYPVGTRRAFVTLIADPQKKVYRADVIDPEKLKFAKGSILVVNFSSQPGMVLLGTKKVSVRPGERAVVAPALEANGMYRLMVAYQDADKKPVPCYDRYIPGNSDSRDMLFLFPDATLGLRVFSLPMFGDMD